MNILLVDDNAVFRGFVSSFIRRNINPQAEVHECEDGDGALARYLDKRPDWVLMDITMGAMDGLTAAQLIRDSDPAARIIILTQHNEQVYRDAAGELGAYAFVLKEHMEELRTLLR